LSCKYIRLPIDIRIRSAIIFPVTRRPLDEREPREGAASRETHRDERRPIALGQTVRHDSR